MVSLLFITLLVFPATFTQAQYAYVANSYDYTVSVVRLSGHVVTATVPA